MKNHAYKKQKDWQYRENNPKYNVTQFDDELHIDLDTNVFQKLFVNGWSFDFPDTPAKGDS